MDLREAKGKLLKDKKRRQAYEKIDLAYEIGKMITDARIAKDHMTQQKLASLVGTKQPSIARLEKGATLPSLSFLEKIAAALDTQLLPPRFEFLVNEGSSLNLTVFFSTYRLVAPWSVMADSKNMEHTFTRREAYARS
jgi:transcriptional regulator with XRE-family HTH domain